MASSTLDLPVEGRQVLGKGHDTESLGPSDSSDSGSDLQGAGGGAAHRGGVTPTGRALGDADLDSDTDASGTGERAMAGRDSAVDAGADVGFDRVVGADEAGLGGGLDQAEEALAGVSDEDADVRAVDALMNEQGVERRGGRAADAQGDEGELARATDAALAGGVDTDELTDQLHSGSDSEADAELGSGDAQAFATPAKAGRGGGGSAGR